MTRLSIARLGQTLGLFFAALYLLCVAWDALFPGEAMRSLWTAALPGFDWLSASGFFLGLLEVYLYGWLAALLLTPIWNHVGAERPRADQRSPSRVEPHLH